MKTYSQQNQHPLIPAYKENAVLQLIIASGCGYVAFHLARIMLMLMHYNKGEVFFWLYPNIGMGVKEIWTQKWWTIATYGWVHHGFWEWFTNMIWLYCFGIAFQNISNFKQVIPLFVAGIIFGGIFFEFSQFFFLQESIQSGNYFLGSTAGVIAIGVAAIVAQPDFRLRISSGFSIPLVLLILVFLALEAIVLLPKELNAVAVLSGGIVAGILYGTLLRFDIDFGSWIYHSLGKIQQLTTPNEKEIFEQKSRKRIELLRTMYEPKHGISQEKIDTILDKIHEHGFHSLSREEKDSLTKANKD
jgi:membrane associated rhomboid family serine protease